MTRQITVGPCTGPDAQYGGRTVRIGVKYDPTQWGAMTLTPSEAEVLRDALTEYLNTTREDQTND